MKDKYQSHLEEKFRTPCYKDSSCSKRPGQLNIRFGWKEADNQWRIKMVPILRELRRKAAESCMAKDCMPSTITGCDCVVNKIQLLINDIRSENYEGAGKYQKRISKDSH